MYLLHQTSELLLPSGQYLSASAIRPGMKVFKGNGKPVHVKTNTPYATTRSPQSFHIQHWPAPIVAVPEQTFLSHQTFKTLEEILRPCHDLMLPTKLDWDIPSSIQLSTGNAYINGSYLLGYALGVAYMTYNPQDRILVIRDPCTRKQFIKYMKKYGFFVTTDSYKVYIDEETAELFDIISKGNCIPKLILAKNPEYCYGIYTGIMEVIQVNQSLSFETFKSMFVLMLLSGCHEESDIHSYKEYIYFKCNNTVSTALRPTPTLYRLELAEEFDDGTGIIVNNTVFGSL